MIPYPNRDRAARAVRRRREAYQRTATARCLLVLQHEVLGPLEEELGFDFASFAGMTAEVLRPYREYEEHMQAQIRARMRQFEPAFRRAYLNSLITELDT
ncbi:hypothetical protein AB0E99_22855 [Streptomyces sp. NPDC030592]|uniref:hypothetical protein n=1 Tax=Streptomyces sp. NPDC030592 TaxID=3155365 RepID=UPI0033E23054